MQTLRVISQIPSQGELHTFYLFLGDFLCENQEKPGSGVCPPGKNQNRNQFVFLSFGVDPLNCQSFIEIGEMACSTTARCLVDALLIRDLTLIQLVDSQYLLSLSFAHSNHLAVGRITVRNINA